MAHLDTRLAVPRCSTNNRHRLGRLLAAIAFLPEILCAQLTTGIIAGTIFGADRQPLAGAAIRITAELGFRAVLRSGAKGEFALALPYGRYQLSVDVPQGPSPSGVTVFIAPLQTTTIRLELDASGAIRATPAAFQVSGIWTDSTRGRVYPEGFSLPGLLLSRDPSSVTEPLDFTGIHDNRLAIASQRGLSWTDVQYRFLGLDATDAYQPGVPAAWPDMQAVDEVVVRSAFAQAASSSTGTEVGLFLSQPGGSWHGALSTANTGAPLSWTNLPPTAFRGFVRQTDRFRWLTRDHWELSGPLRRWADVYASASGQWSSQTEPLAPPGTDQQSRLLFGTVRTRIQAGRKDQLDVLYNGSRLHLSDGGLPAGLEALTGNRMAPSFVLPGGFFGEPENDRFDALQTGWTHLLSAASGLGAVQIRYGYSVAHLETNTIPGAQSRIELLGGAVSGAPPLGNLAARPRHEIEAAWLPAGFHPGGTRGQIVAGVGWKSSEPRNRFTAPSDLNLITVNGAPAFVMEFNTPLDSRELVRSFSAYLAGRLTILPSLALDVGALGDFPRGSLPAQSSPPGAFSPRRTFAARPDLIVWNSLSPRAGFAWQVPHLRGLVLRGSYFRLYAPLAGRYLDFGNPNSFGGSTYQWETANPSRPFQSGDQGNLLLRFGGPHSAISSSLRRPYADEVDVAAELRFVRQTAASVHLFRRDDKDRIAALNAGLPAQAFTPVSILDPGPDGIPGTFDDQRLTVYAQDPATLGQDRYWLTNPAGLRMLNAGLLVEAGTAWRGLALRASFVAEKSYGPTNPGDAVYENDPGVIGALFFDPNTAIHAAGRSFMDRAYVGKIQASYRLPAAWSGIEVASVADYLDGLVFARQLLITGLPQGPFLVAATVRGSPEGGNRAQYAIHWNLRLSRQFALPRGRLAVFFDVLNVTNAAQRLQESDLSGPAFNLRLPVSIQPARFLRLGFRYEF